MSEQSDRQYRADKRTEGTREEQTMQTPSLAQMIDNHQNRLKRGGATFRVKHVTVTEQQTPEGIEYLVHIENADLLEMTMTIHTDELEPSTDTEREAAENNLQNRPN